MLWWWRRKLRSNDPAVCQKAIERLAASDDPRAASALIDALRHDHWKVRTEAIWAVKQLDNPRVIPSLEAMLRDGNESVRRAVAAALRELGREVPEEPKLRGAAPGPGELRSFLTGGEDGAARLLDWLTGQSPFVGGNLYQTVQGAVVEAGQAAMPFVRAALRGDGPPWACELAVAALGRIGGPEAVELLAGALKSERRHVPGLAVSSLEEIHSPPAQAVLQAWRDEKARAEAFTVAFSRFCDYSSAARLYAGFPSTLGLRDQFLRSEHALEVLIDAVQLSGTDAKSTACSLLAELGDRRAIAPLVAALADSAREKIGPNRAWDGNAIRDLARGALDRIDPSWPTSAEARDAIPDLLERFRDGGNAPDDPDAAVLDLIDPGWRQRPSAETP